MDTQYIDYDECSREEFEKEYEKALQEALHGNGKEPETTLKRSEMTGTYDMLSGKNPANAFWEMSVLKEFKKRNSLTSLSSDLLSAK